MNNNETDTITLINDDINNSMILSCIFKDEPTFEKYIGKEVNLSGPGEWIWKQSKEYYRKYKTKPTREVLNSIHETDFECLSNQNFGLEVKGLIKCIFNNIETRTDLDFHLQNLDYLFKRQQVKDILMSFVDDLSSKDRSRFDNVVNKLGINGIDDSQNDNNEFQVYSLSTVKTMDMDENESLINDGFFKRKETMVISGEPSIGKSVLVYQLSVGWSLGKDVVGLKPSKPLKVLILQDEDNPSTVKRMYSSIENRIGSCGDNVRMIFGVSTDYKELTNLLEKNMEEFKPDVLFINPLFNYLNGDVNTNQDVKSFFSFLKPLLFKYDCGGIIIHHSRKDGSSFYGSQVLLSVPRVFINIDWEDKRNHVAKLDVTKRQSESGIHLQRIKWSDDGDLFWELSESNKVNGILDKLNDDYLSLDELIEETGMNKSTLYRQLIRLVAEGKIEHSKDGYRRKEVNQPFLN